MNSGGKGRCAERSGIAVWVPIVLFGFEGKFGVRLSKEKQEMKKCF